MEVEQLGSITQKAGYNHSPFSSYCVSSFLDKLKAKTKQVRKVGEDDPRRIIHSLKVGLALTLVSVFYYITPLFVGFGVSAMWAVLTVVVVMEYTVGGTLSKGLNRSLATLVAGGMGIGAHRIAALCGEKGEAVVLAIFVFILAAAATYSRFLPEVKARYDYGVVIFILTFSLVAVSSYRVDELTQLALQRLTTIGIGVAICLFTSIFVFPVWAGGDLHRLVAANLEKLASFLEGMGEEYFGGEKVGIEGVANMSFLHDYKSVLNAKPIEDSLANFARWEPSHGRFGFRHPWKQYLKIGGLCRQCAQSMEALQNYIITSCKTEASSIEPELCTIIQSTCRAMSIESRNTLTELALSIKTMSMPSASSPHINAAISATVKLKAALLFDEEAGGKPVILPLVLKQAIIASLLVDIVQCVHKITISIEELARLAHFKSFEPIIHRSTVKQSMVRVLNLSL